MSTCRATAISTKHLMLFNRINAAMQALQRIATARVCTLPLTVKGFSSLKIGIQVNELRHAKENYVFPYNHYENIVLPWCNLWRRVQHPNIECMLEIFELFLGIQG